MKAIELANRPQMTLRGVDNYKHKCYSYNIMDIEELKQLQGDLTDQEFANKVGVHRVSWQRIKNQRVPLSDKFLVRIHKTFPEANIFLTINVATSDKEVVIVTPQPPITPETHQNGKLGGLWGWLRFRVLGFFVRDTNKPTKSKSGGTR